MNPIRIFNRLKTDPHETLLKGKFFRLSHANGLFEAAFNFTEAQRDDFIRRSQAIESDLKLRVEQATSTRDAAVKEAKRVAETVINNAHNDARIAKFDLFRAFFALPTLEELAERDTPAGAIVDFSAVAQQAQGAVAS